MAAVNKQQISKQTNKQNNQTQTSHTHMTDIVHSRLTWAVRVCKQFTKSCNINVANSV